MAKKNDDLNPILDWILLFEAIGVVLVEFIRLLVYIVVESINLIASIFYKSQKIWIKNKALKKPFENARIKIRRREIFNRERVLKKLNLFNMNIYKDLFPVQIRNRGEKYYDEGRVKYFKQNGNKYTCRIKGTDTYNVSITLDNYNTNIIENDTCTCLYHKEDNKNCKHIYALLYKIKCSSNKEVLLNEIVQNSIGIITMVGVFSRFLLENMSAYKLNLMEKFIRKSTMYLNRIKGNDELDSLNTDELLINYLIQLLNMRKEIEMSIKDILNNIVIFDKNKSVENEEISNLSELFNFSDTNDACEYTDEQLEHLEPWQVELVKKGEYDPWSFEEDEIEDDDWHSDDEKETI